MQPRCWAQFQIQLTSYFCFFRQTGVKTTQLEISLSPTNLVPSTNLPSLPANPPGKLASRASPSPMPSPTNPSKCQLHSTQAIKDRIALFQRHGLCSSYLPQLVAQRTERGRIPNRLDLSNFQLAYQDPSLLPFIQHSFSSPGNIPKLVPTSPVTVPTHWTPSTWPIPFSTNRIISRPASSTVRNCSSQMTTQTMEGENNARL